MPLIILGLVVTAGIVIYGLLLYARSGDEDTRSVRERYSHAFPPKENPGVREDSGADAVKKSDDGKTLYFPLDAETEKRRRNIH